MIASVNLIPAHRRDARRRRLHLRRWIAACVVYGLLLAGAAGLHALASTQLETTPVKLNEVATRIAGVKHAIGAVTPQLAEAQRLLKADRKILGQPDWSVLLAVVGQMLGEDAVLRSCALTPGAPSGTPGQLMDPMASPGAPTALLDAADSGVYTFRMTGLAQSQQAVSQFVLRLEQAGLFDRVKLINTMRESLQGMDAVAFQLECTMGGTPGTPGAPGAPAAPAEPVGSSSP